MRERISSAALLVNVIASNEKGERPFSRTSQAARCVRTRVLPEPAPATTRSGPPGCVTAAYCAGLSPSEGPLCHQWQPPSVPHPYALRALEGLPFCKQSRRHHDLGLLELFQALA